MRPPSEQRGHDEGQAERLPGSELYETIHGYFLNETGQGKVWDGMGCLEQHFSAK